MPRKTKSKTTVVLKMSDVQALASKGKKVKRAKRRKVRKLPTPFLDLAELIADPCGARVSGVGSVEGAITERARTFAAVNGGTNATCGYVAWFPSYTSHSIMSTAGGNNYNCFFWESAGSSLVPVNTTTAPMGSGGSSGQFLVDPAGPFVSTGSAFSRQKTYSACIQLEWLANLAAIQGQICVVKNMSLGALNRASGTAGAAYAPLSVDEVFQYAAERQRTQVGGHEAIWRPTVDSCVYRTNGQEQSNLTTTATGDLADAIWVSGVPGSSLTVDRCANPNNAYGIVIAWKGWPQATFASGQVVLVKSFALEMAPRSGAIESIPRQLTNDTEGTLIAKAVEFLDATRPGWQTKLMTAGMDKVGALAMAYGPRIIRAVAGPRGSIRGSRMLTDGGHEL